MIPTKFPFTKTDNFTETTLGMMQGLDWSGVKVLLQGWKAGTDGYLTLTKKRKPKSRQQLAYYYGVIIPHAMQAFKDEQEFSLVVEFKGKRIEMELNLENVDRFFKLAYAKFSGKYADKTEMSMDECAAFEDWCIKWVSKWMKYEIPEAEKK